MGLYFQLFIYLNVVHCLIFDDIISEIFGDGQSKVLVEGRIIKALGMFKKGIEPTWEDPANKASSELVAVEKFNSEVLDG